MTWLNRVHVGDCRDLMRKMIADGVKVQICVTSPPYFGLRDYQAAGQIGLEPSLHEWVDTMVEVFDLVRDLLVDDGTLWLNLGDSYAQNGGAGWQGKNGERSDRRFTATRNSVAMREANRRPPAGLKAKDLMGQPWRVAFALQDAGWYLRSDIVWCLSGGAWVYARTQKGDMPVMVKDLVRLNPKTVRLWNGEKWTGVLGWGPSNNDKKRIELVLRSGERIGCTGGHLWPTQRGNVMARDLRVGDIIRSCKLPEPDDCERPTYITNDALWLIGLYLAEGSRSGNANARQLSLSADEQDWLPRIEAIAKHYGGSCSHTITGRSLAVRIYGAVLHSLIDAYIGGSVAIDKHLKVAAWRLPNDALMRVVQGYLDGDGHDDTANARWRLGFCRNYSLERDLRTAAARLGATLALWPETASYQNGDAPTFRGEWRWKRSGHWNEADRGEISEIRLSRARGFWDIAVEDNPHLFALASGVLTHNCKPNPMPESIKDRPTKSHEYIFLLAKSETYHYDAAAIAEPVSGTANARGRGVNPKAAGWARGDGPHTPAAHAKSKSTGDGTKFGRPRQNESFSGAVAGLVTQRNARSVWTMPSEPFGGGHFATFPRNLPRRCILAGSRPGDVILDPFMGSGTTAQVALELGRQFIGCEINGEYAAMLATHRGQQHGLALSHEEPLSAAGGEP